MTVDNLGNVWYKVVKFTKDGEYVKEVFNCKGNHKAHWFKEFHEEHDANHIYCVYGMVADEYKAWMKAKKGGK